jgi:hypothetical protein
MSLKTRQLLIKATGAFQKRIYSVIQAMAHTKITEIQNVIYVGYALTMIQSAWGEGGGFSTLTYQIF